MPPLIAAKAAEGVLGRAAAKKAADGKPGSSGFMVGKNPGTQLHVSNDGSARTGAVPGPGTGHRQLPPDYRYRPQSGARAGASGTGGKVKYRVGPLPLASALIIAAIIDGLQFLATFIEWIPGIMLIPMFLGVVGSGIITLIYSMCGVSYTSGKKALQRLLAIFGTAALEAVPLVDDLPTLTADALFTAMSSWEEDREIHAANMKRREDEAHAARQAQAEAQAQFAVRQAEQAANDNAAEEEAQAA